MTTAIYEAEVVWELFLAHYTIAEIVEQTGLTIDTVVRVLNAPRVVNGRATKRKAA